MVKYFIPWGGEAYGMSIVTCNTTRQLVSLLRYIDLISTTSQLLYDYDCVDCGFGTREEIVGMYNSLRVFMWCMCAVFNPK